MHFLCFSQFRPTIPPSALFRVVPLVVMTKYDHGFKGHPKRLNIS